MTDDMTLREIAALGEICLTRWNGDGFDEAISLTDNDSLDTQPSVAVVNGNAHVVWTTNSEDDLLGTSGLNSIRMLDLGNETISQEVLKENLPAITDLSIGNVNGESCVAYVCDADNDLSSVTDWDLYLLRDEGESRLTENDCLDSNPVFAGNQLFYYSNGNVVIDSLDGEEIQTVFEEYQPGLSDSFQVGTNKKGDSAIWWTMIGDSSEQLYVSLCQEGSWTKGTKLTDMEEKVRYPSGLLLSDGSMVVAFNSARIEDNLITQANLYVTEVIPSYDLSLTEAFFDEDSLQAYVTVINNGELDVASFSVSYTDGGGSLTIEEGLKVGESLELIVPYDPIYVTGLGDIFLSVTSATGTDSYLSDNETMFTVGHPDICVEALTQDGVYVTAKVSNKGVSAASDISVSLRESTAEEGFVDEVMVNLAPGESQLIKFDVTDYLPEIMGLQVKMYVRADHAGDEVSKGNNEAYVFLADPDPDTDYVIQVLGWDEIDGKVVIHAVAENHTDDAISCVFYAASYDPYGKLKSCGRQSATLFDHEDMGVDVTLPWSIAEGDAIKVFMVDMGLRPLTGSSLYVLE